MFAIKKDFFKEIREVPYDIFAAEVLSPFPHLHTDIELIFVEEGFAIAHVDQTDIEISSGDLFMIFPNQVHYYENSARGKYGIYVIANSTFFGKKEIILENVPKKNVVHLNKNDMIYRLMLELLNINESPNKDIITAGMVNTVLGKLLDTIELRPRLKTDNFTLQNILDYCTLNFNSELTLDDAAKSLHLSKYYISYLFNKKFGIGFNTYINTLRVNASCVLLEQTDKKITEIAQESGFNSIRSFNRSFIQTVGVTPSSYRKNKNLTNFKP